MADKKRWSSIAKGDVVEVKGREFTVAKIKPKGSKAKVTLRSAAGSFDGTVALADKVVLTRRAPEGAERTDANGWYKPTKGERKAASAAISAGDAKVTAPPSKPGKDPWMTKRDAVEERLDKYLSAHLVGEATDESVGYYVPPVDVTTIDAHLVLMHGAQHSDWDELTDRMRLHGQMHADALSGEGVLAVNHWHTETRPAASR